MFSSFSFWAEKNWGRGSNIFPKTLCANVLFFFKKNPSWCHCFSWVLSLLSYFCCLCFFPSVLNELELICPSSLCGLHWHQLDGVGLLTALLTSALWQYILWFVYHVYHCVSREVTSLAQWCYRVMPLITCDFTKSGIAQSTGFWVTSPTSEGKGK